MHSFSATGRVRRGNPLSAPDLGACRTSLNPPCHLQLGVPGGDAGGPAPHYADVSSYSCHSVISYVKDVASLPRGHDEHHASAKLSSRLIPSLSCCPG